RGAWAYTLYQGGGSHGDGTFVHALDTATLTARCIDLPGLHVQNTSDLRLALGGGGSRLVVADGGAHRIAIDTRTLRIVSPATAHARAQARTPAKAQAPSESASGTSPAAWLAASIAVAAVAAAAGLRRWRRPHPRSL